MLTSASADSSAYTICVAGISKTFDQQSGSGVLALDNVDLRIAPGEFVTIIGPTGCGKTTLLNIVAGVDVCSSGEVVLGGDLSRRQGLAYVFQHYTLFPWRSALKNVSFGLEMRGLRRSERNRAALQMLDRVGLADFRDAYPHELSGGMRQRVAIAQALATSPRVLLMDEPFGAVDDTTRSQLQGLLVDIWLERRISILFVTHNIDEALVLGDRILVFSGSPGRVIRDLAVTLPRPRQATDRAFTDLFLQVRGELRSLPRAVGDKRVDERC